jgi:hypothetical protein
MFLIQPKVFAVARLDRFRFPLGSPYKMHVFNRPSVPNAEIAPVAHGVSIEIVANSEEAA